jgi:hypothetical protein
MKHTFIACLVILLMTGIAIGRPYTSDEWKLPRPDKVDLTVTFIERVPRYPGSAYSYEHVTDDPELGSGDLLPPIPADTTKKGWPDTGEQVTFIAHVKNAGAKPSLPFDWHWTIDGTEVMAGVTSGGLEPGKELTFTNYWTWQTGDHYVALDINRLGKDDEITRNNNMVVDQINSLAFHFFVEQSLADWFTTVRNGKGSYCWEDWAQLQVQEMNRTFRDDIHPTTPAGIKLRVRLDRIFIIPDGWGDPSGMHTPAIIPPVHYDTPVLHPWYVKTNANSTAETYANSNTGCDGVWGFTTGYLKKDPARGNSNSYEVLSHWLLGPEWALFHELGHQLGLHDFYLTPVNPGQNHALPGVGFDPGTVFRSQMMHSGNYAHDDNIAKGKGRWDCNYRFWEEGAANALSDDRHRRRGMFGWYIDRFPASNVVQFIYEDGTPVGNASVSFFRARGRGYTNPEIPAKPAYTGVTDASGSWAIPGPVFKRAFNWGSNGTFLFTLKKDGKTWYAWITYNDFNLEYYRGKSIGEYRLMVKLYKPEK